MTRRNRCVWHVSVFFVKWWEGILLFIDGVVALVTFGCVQWANFYLFGIRADKWLMQVHEALDTDKEGDAYDY